MERILAALGLEPVNPGATTGGPEGWLTTGGEMLTSVSPIDGRPLPAFSRPPPMTMTP
jgi:hypothetical protein